MFGETTIFCVMIWSHPIETTIKNWLFGVPGKHANYTMYQVLHFHPFTFWRSIFLHSGEAKSCPLMPKKRNNETCAMNEDAPLLENAGFQLPCWTKPRDMAMKDKWYGTSFLNHEAFSGSFNSFLLGYWQLRIYQDQNLMTGPHAVWQDDACNVDQQNIIS